MGTKGLDKEQKIAKMKFEPTVLCCLGVASCCRWVSERVKSFSEIYQGVGDLRKSSFSGVMGEKPD